MVTVKTFQGTFGSERLGELLRVAARWQGKSPGSGSQRLREWGSDIGLPPPNCGVGVQ